MAGRKVGYIYKKESDLDDSLRVNRIVLGIDTSNSVSPPAENDIKFAKVTLIRDNTDSKQAKAIEVQYNATTRANEVPDEPIIYDSENITNDRTTSDIYSAEALAVDDVVEITSYDDKSDLLQWMVRQSGGGAQRPYLEITDSSDINTYEGTVFDNPVDLNPLLTGVVVKALQHDFGTVPNGVRLFADLTGGIYYIQPSTFYGS